MKHLNTNVLKAGVEINQHISSVKDQIIKILLFSVQEAKLRL